MANCAKEVISLIDTDQEDEFPQRLCKRLKSLDQAKNAVGKENRCFNTDSRAHHQARAASTNKTTKESTVETMSSANMKTEETIDSSYHLSSKQGNNNHHLAPRSKQEEDEQLDRATQESSQVALNAKEEEDEWLAQALQETSCILAIKNIEEKEASSARALQDSNPLAPKTKEEEEEFLARAIQESQRVTPVGRPRALGDFLILWNEALRGFGACSTEDIESFKLVREASTRCKASNQETAQYGRTHFEACQVSMSRVELDVLP